MGIEDIALWVLRGFGVLWVVGGLFMLREMARSHQIDKAIDAIDELAIQLGAKQAPPEDRGREQWMRAGAFLTLFSGVAMALASHWAVLLLAALIVQQLGYFTRQRRRELKAEGEAAQEDARPERSTVNGFYTSLFMAVLASWLFWAGRLT